MGSAVGYVATTNIASCGFLSAFIRTKFEI